MGTLVFSDRPNMAKDIKVSDDSYLPVPDLSFKVEMTIDDKIFKQIKDDSILIKDMHKAVEEVYDLTCNSIGGKIAAFNKLFPNMAEKGESIGAIKKNLTGVQKSIENDRDVAEVAAEKAVEACWTKYLKKHEDYTKYKIKIGVKIAGATAGLATSIGLTIAGGFSGGASAALGIIGMVKSVVVIAKEIRSAVADINKAIMRLEADLGKLKKLSDELQKVNNYAGAIVDNFLGVSQPCINTVIAQLEVIESKLNGVEIKAHEAAKILNKMLDDKDDVVKGFLADASNKLNKMFGYVPKGQIDSIEDALDTTMSDAEIAIRAQIKHVEELHEEYEDAEARVQNLQKRMEPIKKLRGVDDTILQYILLAANLGLGSLDGNALAKTATLLEEGMIPVAASFAYDKLTDLAIEHTSLV